MARDSDVEPEAYDDGDDDRNDIANFFNGVKPKNAPKKVSARKQNTISEVGKFRLIQSGWHVVREGDEGKERLSLVVSPFEVLGRTVDETGDGDGLLIEFPSRRDLNDIRQHIIPADALHRGSDELRADLSKTGLEICPKEGKNVFLELLWALLREEDKKVITASRPGWLTGTNVWISPLGEAVNAAEGVTYSLKNGAGATLRQRKGPLKAQVALTNEMMLANPLWAFAAAVHLTGVLIQRLDRNTSIINFTGPSSTGKTTGQYLGASFFASVPRDGLVRPAKATSNGFEVIASKATGSALVIDELGRADPREVSAIVFDLASDSGKARMSRSLKEAQAFSWSTIATISSERTIKQLIESSGKAYIPGMVARAIDCNISGAKVSADKMRDFEARLRANYGHIGPAFAAAVAKIPIEELHELALAEEYEHENSVLTRAGATLALVVLAAKLARLAGLFTPESSEAAILATNEAWNSLIENEAAVSADPYRAALQRLQTTFFNEKNYSIHLLGYEGMKREYRDDNGDVVETGPPEKSRVTKARYGELRGTHVLFCTDDAIEWMAKPSIPVSDFVSWLQREGFLITQGKNRSHSLIPHVGNQKHYRIDMKRAGLLLEDDFGRPGPTSD